MKCGSCGREREKGKGLFVGKEVVQVEWSDAFVHGGWVDAPIARNPGLKIVFSVGYLLEITRENVKLFMSQSEDDIEIGMLKVVPRSLVREIRWFTPRGRRWVLRKGAK